MEILRGMTNISVDAFNKALYFQFFENEYALADAQVACVSDLGNDVKIFSIRTYLGHILSTGDYALGYDLYAANTKDMELDKHRGLILRDAILIRKSSEEKRWRKCGLARPWKLKALNMEVDENRNRANEEKLNRADEEKLNRADEEKLNTEYDQFLRDLEENPNLSFNISLYRNKDCQPSEMASVTDGELLSIPLEELLVDLDLSDEEMEPVE